MAKVAGIEFAPLNIPFERRLQTLAALYWCTTFLFFGLGGFLFVILLLCSRFYYLALIYLVWFVYDRKQCQQGGRRSQWVRNWTVWKLFRDYFPVKLIKTADLDPNKNYIMGYHPHGIMCPGAFCNFATEATGFTTLYPQIKPTLLTLEGNFWFPVHREFVMSTGVCSVDRKSLEYILTKQGKGNAVIIVVGGAAEALDAHPHQAVLTLERRKGFVKYALRLGASLVPIFSFGENELYEQAANPEGSKLRTLQTRLKDILGFSLPVIKGRGIFQYTFGYVPYRRPIHTVVGKPIDVEKIQDPTEEDIKKYHDLYLNALKDLFDKYKVKMGDDYKNMILKII